MTRNYNQIHGFFIFWGWFHFKIATSKYAIKFNRLSFLVCQQYCHGLDQPFLSYKRNKVEQKIITFLVFGGWKEATYAVDKNSFSAIKPLNSKN